MDPMAQAKRPVTTLAGPYGHPIHPALVAVPIGAWVASLVFDIGSRVVDDPGFLVQGSRWLIAVGVLGAVVAALAGLLDLFAIPGGTPAYRTALLHMSINLAVTVAYGINFVVRGGPGVRTPVSWGLLLLSAGSLAALGVAGYLGGKLVFHHGVRVAEESDQAPAYRTTGATPSTPEPKGTP